MEVEPPSSLISPEMLFADSLVPPKTSVFAPPAPATTPLVNARLPPDWLARRIALPVVPAMFTNLEVVSPLVPA